MEFEYKWRPCIDSVPQEYDGFDWVLVQFKEKDSDFQPVPIIAEYQKETNVWHFSTEDENFISYFSLLDAIAWIPIPPKFIDVTLHNF